MPVTTPPSADANWRDTARPAKLGPLNATAVFPIVLWLIHIKLWTFFLALSFIGFLVVIDYYGFNITRFGRFLRCFMAGNRRLATPWWH